MFVHFALDVVELLQQAKPWGLDKDAFLNAYFIEKLQSSPPTDQVERDAWWDEFKRAKDYSNSHFNEGISPWAWIRARPGSNRGRFFYHIVGQRDNDRVKIEGDPASLDRLDDFHNRRWLTQTKSRQRVRAARGVALIHEGNTKNDRRLVDRGQALLNEIVTLSPGLAAVNFDTGIVMDDLQRLATSDNPTIRLLNGQLRNALRSGRRFENDIAALVGVVLALADIHNRGSLNTLP